MQAIRIIEIPGCKMVSSGVGMFGEEKLEHFAKWFSSLPPTMHSRDFLFQDEGGFHWLFMHDDSMEVPAEFGVVDFEGGLYAVTTDIDGKTDVKAMDKALHRFLKDNGLARDEQHPRMGHIISSPLAQEILGYAQMDYFMPVKAR